MKICMGCMNQIEETVRTCPYCGYDAESVRQESYYLKPGSIIGGKYIVGRVLNYSGHTVSYMGFNAEANRKVVIKEYLPSDFSTRVEGEKDVTIYSGDAMEKFEQGLVNFLNEANRIQHLNKIEGIAKIYDCLSENDTGYVISEYIEGHTLKEILDTGKRYSPEEARIFISKILRGLCLVHPLNIIHCDISPETIMITQSGEIKLLDFGATRYVTTENSKSLAIILKQGYAPEEQYRSRGVRGPWTDVYALAAVLYRMITGIVPQESVERMLNDELKAPSQMGVAIPENLENALMNALNVYQPERTQSAEMFLRELNSSTVNRIQVKKRKRETGKIPMWTKGLVAGLLCLVIAGGIVFFQLTKGEEEHEIVSSDVRLEDFVDKKTYEGAQSYIDTINKNDEINIEIALDKYQHKYSNDKSKEGKICYQSVVSSANLIADLEKGSNGTTDLTLKNGKVSGTIKVGLYRCDKLFFEEVGNAFTLAEQLGTTIDNDNRFDPKGTKGEYHDYYSIKEILLKSGKEISGNKLGNKKAANKEITIDDIKKVIYYADGFFYWSNLKDYKGKMLNQIGKQKLYKLDGTQKKPMGKKLSLSKSNLVDNSFYTFKNNYQVGKIVEQTKTGEVDSRELEQEKKALFKVIRYKFVYKNKTGKELERMIRKKLGKGKLDIQFSEGEGERGSIVKDVNVKKNGSFVDYFSNNDLDNIQIIITTQRQSTPPDVTPVPARPPANNNPGPNKGNHTIKM